MRGLPIFFCKESTVIEDLLAQNGIVPDIDDERLGEAYERCPAVQKSVIKNGVSFAYALAQTGSEPVLQTRRFSHVEQSIDWKRLDWAFFAVDLRRFPLPAVFSAMVQALVAKVDTMLLHVSGPLTEPLLFGCDLLSVNQIFTGDPQSIMHLIGTEGQGICIDLAGLALDCPRMVRPDPASYGVAVQTPDSDYTQAYRAVTAEATVPSRPYISYGGEAGCAPVVMADRLLGCWVWDVITPHTFRHVSYTFS